MNQHDCKYSTVQNVVIHAERLWQILNSDKLHQKIKKAKEKIHQQFWNTKEFNQQSDHQTEEQQSSQQNSQWDQQVSQQDLWQDQTASQNSRSENSEQKSQLSDKKKQYHQEKHLCYNCDYSDHINFDCFYLFNLNWMMLRSDEIKFQSTWAYSRKCESAVSLNWLF